MPAASNGGDERTAHTGPAVTRPAAWATGTCVAGILAGQPAASRTSRQAACARAAGTSRMNGLSVTASPAVDGDLDLGTRVESRGLLGNDDIPVGGGEHGQQRGQPEQGRGHAAGDLDLDDVEAPGCRRQVPREPG